MHGLLTLHYMQPSPTKPSQAKPIIPLHSRSEEFCQVDANFMQNCNYASYIDCRLMLTNLTTPPSHSPPKIPPLKKCRRHLRGIVTLQITIIQGKRELPHKTRLDVRQEQNMQNFQRWPAPETGYILILDKFKQVVTCMSLFVPHFVIHF